MAAALKDARARVKEPRPLGPAACDLMLDAADLPEVRLAAQAAVDGLPVDVCVQPAHGRKKRLFVADMDSTIIGCECIDEIADFAGKKAQIAAITERAMRGELEFEGALRERVGMLKGLSVDALQSTYDERVRLNPGARILVRTMSANGAVCVLVSGGFSFFSARVAEAAGFQANRANTLIEGDGVLAGMCARHACSIAWNSGVSIGAKFGGASGQRTFTVMPSSLTICSTFEMNALGSVSGRRRQSKLIDAFSGMMLIL